MTTKKRSPRVRAGGKRQGRENCKLTYRVSRLTNAVNHQIARLQLALAERAINRPFSMRASLRLDRALLRAEELGVAHGSRS